jgi:polysaccharide biosynthesis transport protein
MNLRTFSTLIRARYRLIAVTLIAFVVTAGALSLVWPKTYEASATMIVGNATGTVTPSLDATLVGQRLSQTYAAVATQRATLARVIDRLKLDMDPEDLAKLVDATARTENNLVEITVKASTPELAAAIANAVADDIIDKTPALTGRDPQTQTFIDASLTDTQAQITATQARADELSSQTTLTPQEEVLLASLQQRLTTLQTSYTQLLSLASSASANLATLSDPAVAPTKAASPSLILNILLALIAGMLMGIALALAADHLDDSVRSSEEVESLVGLPTLGLVGRQRVDRGAAPFYMLSMLLYPRSAIAEAYRLLRTNVGFASVDKPVQVVLVTSPLPGEGKTAVASNLAVAFAQDGRSTILVDADLRRPGVHQMFRLSGSPGLTNLLLDDKLALADLLQPTEQPGLRVLPMGEPPPNPAELVGTNRMAAVLALVRTSAEIVIIDSPPIQLVADAALLAQHADGTILVVDSGHTPVRALTESVETLKRAGVHLLGAVLNRVPGATTTAYVAYGNQAAGPGDGAPIASSAGTTGQA